MFAGYSAGIGTSRQHIPLRIAEHEQLMHRIVRVDRDGAIGVGANQQTFAHPGYHDARLWRIQPAALLDLKFDVDTVTVFGFCLRHPPDFDTDGFVAGGDRYTFGLR
jgi:hypothetical protein